MSADLDRMLSASLQAHVDAGSPIDPQPLLRTAVARGRRLRVRRRVVTTALVVTAVAGAAITTVLLPRHHPATPLSPDPSSSTRQAVNLARLPAADGQPGAAARPDLVGSDPGVLHFSVDALAASSRRVTWTSEAGMETADVQRFDFQAFVALATARQKLAAPRLGYTGYPGIVLSDPVEATVGDHPATLRTSSSWEDRDQQGQARLYSFEWQPVAGLWARGDVQTTSRERAEQILGQVRLDQARRCALPMRLGALPATTTVGDCTVALAEDSPGVFSSGSVTVADGQRRLKVQAEAVPPGSGDYPRPLKAGPYRVFADPGGSWTMLVDGVFVTASPATRKDRYTQAEVLRILGDIRFADQVHDPATW
jgi:hypothetical protein